KSAGNPMITVEGVMRVVEGIKIEGIAISVANEAICLMSARRSWTSVLGVGDWVTRRKLAEGS
ncbi:hypothetical protein A2U01_0116524, partial [Trifolium medium]|nr:hypothetical protein [Trifolium medium]